MKVSPVKVGSRDIYLKSTNLQRVVGAISVMFNVDSLEVEPNNLPLSSEYPSDAINLSGVVFRIIHAVETFSTF